MNYNDPENVPLVWQVGDVILERYEVKQVFTSGGMGLVYRVHHRDWAMDLAVKSPRPEFFETQQHIENFEREAETWVNLGLHPHTVSCYYVRRLGGIPRIFTEFVDGGSLADWIRSRRLYEGGPDTAMERILDIAIQFAWGLHFAHEQGLIHQDVKPGNVLLSADGNAKVADFGLANARRASAESTTVAPHPGQSLLVPGSGFMTPEYASPEQLRGEHLSRKTDIWSWAVSLLEMLLGELTWASGIAAPVALEELDDHHIDEKLVAVLNSCFGAQGHTRITSFEPALEALMCYYTSRFGSYPREAPNTAHLSSDETNNRAISMADLGRNEDALLMLETALAVDPGHILATYNYALLNRRLGYKSDAFGRDALHSFLEHDSTNQIAIAANALFSLERGLGFLGQHLSQKLLTVGDTRSLHSAELNTMLRGICASTLQPPDMMKFRENAVNGLRLSPNGRHILITEAGGGLTIFRAEDLDHHIFVDPGYRFLCWASEGLLLEKERRIYEWNLNDKSEAFVAFRFEIPENDCFAISNTGHRCFVACGTSISMFNTETGSRIWEEELEDYSSSEYGEKCRVSEAAFSGNATYIAFDYNAPTLQARDAENGEFIDIPFGGGGFRSPAPLGKTLIISTDGMYNPLIEVLDFEERAGYYIERIPNKAQLGIPSGAAERVAILHPNKCIEFIGEPRLGQRSSISAQELKYCLNITKGTPTCLASADGCSWLVGTSEGEVIRLRLSEPRRAPFLIAKPASHGRLSERWRTQANLLEEAKRHFAAGALAVGLARSRAASAIRGGKNKEAVELQDQIIELGRKERIVGGRLAFDIELTILGGQFQLIDVTPDGRCALAERTHFSRNTDYSGDHYRILHLPDGRMESVPDIEIARHLIRRVSPRKDCIISATPSGFVVAPLGSANGCARPFSAPAVVADASKHSGGDRDPSYYTSDVQFALGGEIVVAADLASEWCSDKGRCDEWHLFARSTRRLTRIHTNSSHVRIMPDGFHAYTADPQAIWLLQWPFQKASSYGYPDGVFGAWNSPKGVERREIRLDAIAFSSDRSKLFFADSKGGLYVRNLKDSYAGWEKKDAHAEMISRCFAGADPRFLITVAADGLKLWNTEDMAVVLYRDDLKPTWVSDDFRFLVEQEKGTVWELEWEYSFETPEGIEKSALPHMEDFLRCRQAVAEVRGIQLSWDHDACETLARELAKCGCGLLSAERANSLATVRFPYLLRSRMDPTT